MKDMKGFIKPKRKKPVTEAEMKEAVLQGVLEKFDKKKRDGRY